ncbi:hypothetical protein VmeM32_00034 [Vibrio phage vB_VmeM-32]|nr:hypothetical protein VmeM32_00034 [Vibrio phage vB_VmeM-32]
MLCRCYDPKTHERQSTYVGCVVCDAWQYFQTFAEWYDANYPKDWISEKYQLDKDLKVNGSKIYSPETCLFVSSVVNTFTTDSGSTRGEHLIGVCWHKGNQKFMARCCNPFTRKQEHLGYFTNELDAHKVWRKRKSELAYELAMVQTNDEVKNALLNWKKMLDENKIHIV